MNDLGQFISNVGFPIAVTCGLGYLALQMYNKMCNTLDTVTETNKELVNTNKSLIATLDNKIDKVEMKVDRIIDEIK